MKRQKLFLDLLYSSAGKKMGRWHEKEEASTTVVESRSRSYSAEEKPTSGKLQRRSEAKQDRRGELYSNSKVRGCISHRLVYCVCDMGQGLAVSENVAKCAQHPQLITSKKGLTCRSACMIAAHAEVLEFQRQTMSQCRWPAENLEERSRLSMVDATSTVFSRVL